MFIQIIVPIVVFGSNLYEIRFFTTIKTIEFGG